MCESIDRGALRDKLMEHPVTRMLTANAHSVTISKAQLHEFALSSLPIDRCPLWADSVEEVGWQIGAHEAFRPIVLNDLR